MEKINRLKKFFIEYIKDNYKEIIFLIIFACFCFYDTGYSIYKPGGIINVDDRIVGVNLNNSKGTLNMAYVGYMEGKTPLYLIAKLIPSWEIVKNEDITYKNEDIESMLLRDRLDYKEAISNALYVALNKSNSEFKVKGSNYYVFYLTDENDSELKIGDEIISYDGINFEDFNDFKEYINNSKVGDVINLEYKRGSKNYNTSSTIYENEGNKYVGFSIVTLYDIESNYNIEIKSKESESGPSGGLMMSLSIYNKLVKEDITKGLKIVGTGTIDKDGNVGPIGGVNYKLATAVKKHADIFICPDGNYDEVKEIMKKNKYNIKIISLKIFSYHNIYI